MAVEIASVARSSDNHSSTLCGQSHLLLRENASLFGVRSFKDRGSHDPLLFACHKINVSHIADTSYFETWRNSENKNQGQINFEPISIFFFFIYIYKLTGFFSYIFVSEVQNKSVWRCCQLWVVFRKLYVQAHGSERFQFLHVDLWIDFNSWLASKHHRNLDLQLQVC